MKTSSSVKIVNRRYVLVKGCIPKVVYNFAVNNNSTTANENAEAMAAPRIPSEGIKNIFSITFIAALIRVHCIMKFDLPVIISV